MFSYYEVDYVIYNKGSGRDFLELYYNFDLSLNQFKST